RRDRHDTAARPYDETAILVDGLEYAAHDIAVDPNGHFRAQSRGARQPAPAYLCQPRAISPDADILAPGVRERQEQRFGVAVETERPERSRRIGDFLGMRGDVDADPDGKRYPVAGKQR